MAPRCDCAAGTCACLIANTDTVTVSGHGTTSDPYRLAADIPAIVAVDTETVDMGVVVDEAGNYQIAANATLSMAQLSDVNDDDLPNVGDVPVWDGTQWLFAPGGSGGGGAGLPPGGTDGQVLTKQSATDGDADWENPGSAVVAPPYAASRRHATATSITNGTWTILPFDTPVYEDGVVWDATGKYFQIPVDGYYDIDAGATFTGNATGYRAASIHHNSGIAVTTTLPGTSITHQSLTLATTIKAVAGDYVSYRVWQNSGANLALVGAVANHWLTVTKSPHPSPGGGGVVVERPVAASRRHAAAVVVPNNTQVTIPWDTEDYTDGITYSGGGVFAIPSDGYYQVNTLVSFPAMSASNPTIRLYVNGAGSVGGVAALAPGPSGSATTLNRVVKLTAGDLLQINASQISGVSVTIPANSPYNWINITKVPAAYAGSAVSTYGERNYYVQRGHVAATSIPNATTTPVPFDTAVNAENIVWNGVDGFTVPVDGYYNVEAVISYSPAAAGTGVRSAFILLDGSSQTSVAVTPNAGSQVVSVPITQTIKCVAGQKIGIGAYQTSGAALNLAGGAYARVSVTKVPAPVVNGAAASGVWGAGPLAGLGSDSLVGGEVYIDSNGQLRTKAGRAAPRTARQKTTTQALTTANTYYTVTFETDYNNGTGITYSAGVFTMPEAGVYQINLLALLQGPGTALDKVRMVAEGNSIGEEAQTNSGNNSFTQSRAIRFAAGGTFYVEASSAATGIQVTGSSARYTFIDITRISA